MASVLRESFESGNSYRFASFTSMSIVTSNSFSLPIIDGARNLLSAGAGQALFIPTTARDEFFIGFYYIFGNSATGTLFDWRNGATVLGDLRWNSANAFLEARVNGSVVGTSTHPLSVQTKYHIQLRIKISDASGVIQTKLDDTLDIDVSSIDTKPGAATTIDRFMIGTGNSSTNYYDNICINDTSGGSDTSWPGIKKFFTLTPNANGNYNLNWTRSNAGIPAWDNVDEIPNDGDTTYLSTTSAGLKESFGMTNQALSNASYDALITTAVAKKDSGTVTLQVGIRDLDDNTDYLASAQSLGTSYAFVEERRTVDPSTGIAWTSSGINNTEALIASA